MRKLLFYAVNGVDHHLTGKPDHDGEAAVNQRWIKATAVVIAVAVALTALYYLIASF